MERRLDAINIVLIGAHPDDCELCAGGTCPKWAQAGHRVILVSATDGDKGHHEMTGAPLAERRAEESRQSAQRAGVESVILGNHDGELTPSLEARKEIVALIRQYEADVVITHRPNDYHPDHRYTAQLVQDAAYMVTVPHFHPEVAALEKNPVFMYFMDAFQKPLPFEADVAVAVDDTMTVKWRMLDSMESQMYEWLPWHDGILTEVPKDSDERMKWLQKTWKPRFRKAAQMGRESLKEWYGKKKAADVEFAELFEVSEYGHQPTEEELRAIFPFLPDRKKKRD